MKLLHPTLRLALALLALALTLTACGGGEEEDTRSDRQPIDCKATPELCR
jgi:ABC-type glycerol-3-phosphate transport system substrate-binding protein